MKKLKFSLLDRDERVMALISKTDHKILGIWAKECALRVLPYFEDKYPNDKRPRIALNTLQDWIDTGKFSMKVIRKASLDAHAAARDVGEDSPARSAARAIGQAVATAHVPKHSLGGALYALQALFRANEPAKAEAIINKERDWQYTRLLKLSQKQGIIGRPTT